MIKNIFLNYKSKAKPQGKEHCTYIDAIDIGILYNAEEFNDKLVNKLVDLIEGDGKSTALLGYVKKSTDEPLFFSKKDISGTGIIKKDSIRFFVNQTFDFLLSLDTSGNINYKYVLSMSKATCKVGLETETYSDLLQMSLKSEGKKLLAVVNMVKYLKMI